MSLDLASIQPFAAAALATMGALQPASVAFKDAQGSVTYTDPRISALTGPVSTTFDKKGGGTLRYQEINVWLPKDLMEQRPVSDAATVFKGVTYTNIETEDDNAVNLIWHFRAVRFLK